MFRKTIFTLIIVLTLMVNSNEVSKAGFFDDSIDFDKGAVAAWWECDVSDYYKVKSCSITGDHDASDTCTGSSYHNVSENWKNKPEQIVVNGVANYEGNGYVRFSATGGRITLNGGVYQQLTSRTTAGEPVGSMPQLKKKGSNKKKPRYTLVHGTGTVRKAVYKLGTPTLIGSYTLTVDSGTAIGDGFEASGGAYVEISATTGVTEFSVTGTYGVTVEWSKGREVTTTGILSNSWDWQVSEKNMCNSHNPPQEISEVHAHHWICPEGSGSMNGGCGAHIQCGNPESNIPDYHKLQDVCPGPSTDPSGHCSVGAPYRKCTHSCEYYSPDDDSNDEPIYCARELCGKVVSDPYEHYIKCGTQDASNAPSCGQKFWSCVPTIYDRHKPRSCDKSVRNDDGTHSECPAYLRNCKHIKGYHTVSWKTWHHSND
ncbi:hypothetical protein C6501_04930 [Candidatus Poribacteria bacterium]|nr:MAG: hypothetical protein C6501_04930 [Candidatus Poribacteria bacterium]